MYLSFSRSLVKDDRTVLVTVVARTSVAAVTLMFVIALTLSFILRSHSRTNGGLGLTCNWIEPIAVAVVNHWRKLLVDSRIGNFHRSYVVN